MLKKLRLVLEVAPLAKLRLVLEVAPLACTLVLAVCMWTLVLAVRKALLVRTSVRWSGRTHLARC